MAYRRWNLLLRFMLELAALVAFGVWGWKNYGWAASIGIPFVVAALWGVFAVPGDRSRSGRAVVPIPGWLRILLELVILYGAAWALFVIDQSPLALTLGAVVTLHYMLSLDRLGWLVSKRVRY
jgi:hypothetical protein